MTQNCQGNMGAGETGGSEGQGYHKIGGSEETTDQRDQKI